MTDDWLNTEFVSESGRVLTRERLFRIGLREGGLSRTDSGYILNCDHFTPIEDDEEG